MKKITVIIINYNTHEETIACLTSLQMLETNDLQVTIILVDNGSKTDDKAALSKFIKGFSDKKFTLDFIDSTKNLGFTGGNNLAIKKAQEEKNDYIVFLNSDTIVDKKLLIELIVASQVDEKIGIVAPKIYFDKGYEFHKDRYTQEQLGKILWYAGGIMDWKNSIGKHRGVDEVDTGQYDKKEETDFASGCCFLIKCSVLHTVGVFDDRYFLYYEEADLNKRVKQHGYTIMYAPKAVLWHKNASSTGGSGSLLQDYYITRNRLLFAFTYASLRVRFALLRESLRIFLRGRKWQKIGVRDFFMGRFGKGSYPLI